MANTSWYVWLTCFKKAHLWFVLNKGIVALDVMHAKCNKFPNNIWIHHDVDSNVLFNKEGMYFTKPQVRVWVNMHYLFNITLFWYFPRKNNTCLKLQIKLIGCTNCAQWSPTFLSSLRKITEHFNRNHRRTYTWLTTRWAVRGSNSGGGEIFCTRSDRSWGPTSLLQNGTWSLPRG